METIKGRGFSLGDNIDTDQILPGYAMSYPVEELKTVTLTGSEISNFPEIVQEGDLVFGGDNFGCGSSREQAPVALKLSGVGGVIAKSFARIFRKNSINIGLPVMTCDCIDEIKAEMEADDEFELDVYGARLKNLRTESEFKLNELSESTIEILKAGGLINRVKVILEERGESNE